MSEPTVEVEYFTDPVCSWSWAMEPQLLRFRAALGDRATWTLRLVGMLGGGSFSDPIQHVHQPAQWAPQWVEVSRRTGMPVDPRIWHDDPPQNSRLACLAVAAATAQGSDPAWALLRRVREAVMLERQNVARFDVLDALAGDLADEGILDHERWRSELETPEVRARVRADMSCAAYDGIRRFPSLLVRPAARPDAMLITGWRPWDVLTEALAELGVRIDDAQPLQSIARSLTEEERQELGLSSDDLEGWRHELAGPTSIWRAPSL